MLGVQVKVAWGAASPAQAIPAVSTVTSILSRLPMEIRFQPALLQEVIDSFVEKTEREGDPTYYKEFHEHADPIYEKFIDRKSTRLNSSHMSESRMPSSA